MKDGALVGRVAIVTGASSGIGRATSQTLAEAGARVVLASRTTAALEEVANLIRARGREALVLPTDVTDRAQVAQLVEGTLARWGQVDILVANAGVYVRGPLATLTVEDIERSMAINFYGSLYLVLAALPHMLERRSGHIVLVASMAGKKGTPLDAPYASAKFALTGFGDVARQELRPRGIYVTTVLPGRVATPFIDGIRFHPISAPIPAEKVARAILRAIARRQAQVVVPRRAHAMILATALAPRLADWVVRYFRLEGWREDQRP